MKMANGTNRAKFYEKSCGELPFYAFIENAIIVITFDKQKWINHHNDFFVEQQNAKVQRNAGFIYDHAKLVMNAKGVVIARRKHSNQELDRIKLVPKVTHVVKMS